MLDNMSLNQRLLLATVISMVFFIAYTAVFMPQPKQNQTATQKESVSNATIDKNAAPKDMFKSSIDSDTASSNIDTSAPEAITDTDGVTVVESEKYIIKIDTLGRISSMTLKDSKYMDNNLNPAQVVSKLLPKPLEIRFDDKKMNKEAFSVDYSASAAHLLVTENSPKKLVLRQKLSGVEVVKTVTFYSDGHYDLNINLSNDVRYYISTGAGPKVNTYEMTVMGALIYDSKEQFSIVEDGDATGNEAYRGVKIASAFDRYYTTLFYSPQGEMNVVLARTADGEDDPLIFVEGSKNLSLLGYIGPKEYATLERINPELTEAIEYGWFTFIANPLFLILQYLYDLIGNWGWAIVALTFLIRAVLYPLTYKGMVSMQKLKDIAPKIKEIQKKYKGDSSRMNAKMMELYKKHNANPMGGCLPLLLQIPVFFAIYRVLLNSIELQGAEWIFWIEDLALKDPYFVLPILMGASMYLQQRMTPSNFTDPMQEKIFKFLPIIFTFFFLTFPAGLTLYWFVNNLFSILQQYIVNKQFEAARVAKEGHDKG